MPAADYLDDYRRAVEGFNNGDLSAFAATLDENVVAHTVARWPEQVLVGADSYVNFVRQLLDSVGGVLEVKELRQVGEIVAARFLVRMHGQASALEQEREYGQLIVYHGGKAVLILFFDEYADALAAIGAAPR